MSLDDITARTAADIQPPLYYYLLHLWMLALGQGEFAVRLLSAAFSAMTIPVIFQLARRLISARTGAIAALHTCRVAISCLVRARSAHVRHGHLLGHAILLPAAARPRRRQGAEHAAGAAGPAAQTLWLLYALTNIAAVYTHYYAFFLVAFQLIFLVAVVAGQRPPTPATTSRAGSSGRNCRGLPTVAWRYPQSLCRR